MKPSIDDTRRTGGRRLRRVIFTREQIASRVQELGDEISASYGTGEELLLLGLLKGSFMFVADLVRCIRQPVQIDFVVTSSYGADMVSSGNVQLLYDPEVSLRGRHVILVDDIIDSGKTMAALVPLIRARGPGSLEMCTFLHKRRNGIAHQPRWVGFDAPREFVVGYGLDYSENFRHLPYIASI
jgi:hypoxanthine phosphoribosyltransferase